MSVSESQWENDRIFYSKWKIDNFMINTETN